MFRILAVVPELNLDELQESLQGNSVALAVAAVVAVVIVLLAFRFIRKTIMRIIILILAVLVVGYFVLRVTGNAIELDDLKKKAADCGVTVRGDGSWELNEACLNLD